MSNFNTEARQALKDINTSKGAVTKEGKRSPIRLRKQVNIIIVWGMIQGWSAETIAREIGISGPTVRKRQNEFFDSPYLLFNLPIMSIKRTGRRVLYTCGFCDIVMSGQEIRARTHVAGHILSPELIVRGVMAPDYPRIPI